MQKECDKDVRIGVSNEEQGNNKLKKTSFDVLGICCPSEVPLIEKILKPLAGVESVLVNVPSRTVTVLHDPVTISSAQIVKVLNQARLDASVTVRGQLKSSKKWPSPYTIASGFLLLISFCKFWFSPLKWVALGAVAAGLPPILLKSFAALRQLFLDINVLMVIAVGGSVALGDYLEAGTIVFLFTLAEWLESRSTDKARAALTAVMNLAPQTAILQESDQKVGVEDVQVNTMLSVKAGETVPIDAVVVSGRSTVDESSLTGESMPVVKEAGAVVSAGTLNLTGYLCVRTTALASDSTIAKMVKLVEEAQNQRSRTDQIVQKFAKWYTPAVVLLAAGIAAEALINKEKRRHYFYVALQVLVIACPCALVISTPVATTCGLVQAATMGLLIKGSNILEALGKVKGLAFDKTGTLTEGEFRVTHIQVLDNSLDHHALLHWMLSLESKSSHPMSSAIVAYVREQGINDPTQEVEDYENVAGEGITASVSGHRVSIGNARMATRLGWILPELGSNVGGATIGYVGMDDKVLVVFHVADTVRPEAKEAIAKFKKMGIVMTMLTGDSVQAATAVEAQVGEGMMTTWAGLLPEEKVRKVEEMKREIKKGMIGMVGDGINDAPALAAADVGIAMGVAGSAVAMETADVALMSNDLRRLAEGMMLGRRCLRKIYVNIAIAFVTKGAILGLTFAGYAALWIAVVADVGTCLLVTFNSMLLLTDNHDHGHHHNHSHGHHGGHKHGHKHHKKGHSNNDHGCCAKSNVASCCAKDDVALASSHKKDSSCCCAKDDVALASSHKKDSSCHDHKGCDDSKKPASCCDGDVSRTCASKSEHNAHHHSHGDKSCGGHGHGQDHSQDDQHSHSHKSLSGHGHGKDCCEDDHHSHSHKSVSSHGHGEDCCEDDHHSHSHKSPSGHGHGGSCCEDDSLSFSPCIESNSSPHRHRHRHHHHHHHDTEESCGIHQHDHEHNMVWRSSPNICACVA